MPDQAEGNPGILNGAQNRRRYVAIRISDHLRRLAGDLLQPILCLPDLAGHIQDRIVGQNGVIAGVVPDFDQRMAREFSEFVRGEGPVGIGNGLKSCLSELCDQPLLDFTSAQMLE